MSLIKKDVTKVLSENQLNYFLSIIFDRAVADLSDGLKPVQRRILYIANELNLNSNKPHKKSASLVGKVMGDLHPHGDASIYDAEIRMTQDWINMIPLLDGHGNFGNISGDDPAAMRYTEIRLSKAAEDLILKDINKNAVDEIPNFDNTHTEPELLPASFCNLLVNGGYGIAGGFMQSIPTHNIKDICEMTIKVIENPDITVQEIASDLVPDLPTGGIFCSKKDIENAYITGRGSVKLRAKATHVVPKKGREYLTISEIPYMTNSSNVILSIVSAVKEGKIENKNITDIEDHSSGDNLDIRVFLAKDADPEVVLNQLYKFTSMEVTLKLIYVCKNKNKLKVYNIKEIFTEWIEFRRNTLRRIFIYDITKLKQRDHIIDGLVIALANIDEVIAIIKKSKSVEDARTTLKTKYDLTDLQTKSIVDMRLSSLTNLEVTKLKDEKKAINEEIVERMNNLDKDNIDKIIINEQKGIINKYSTPRKTDVQEISTNITTEDIIPNEDALVVITQGNYIKRVKTELKEQKRGGKGINIGENNITEIFSASTKDHLLCFTNLGRVFDIKVWELKAFNLKAKGLKIESYMNLKDNEVVTNILCISNQQMDDRDSYLVFLTKNGYVKKSKLDLFKNIRNTGLIAIMLRNNDELACVKYIDCSKEMQDLLISTKNGLVVRYEHNEIEERGRDTIGVIAINLTDGDSIADMTLIDNNEQFVFFATKNGLGKIVKVHDMVVKKDPNTKEETDINDGFPRQKRSSNSKGRIGIKLKEDDNLVSIATIDDANQQLMILTKKKMMLISSGEFRKPVKRPTFGMKLINLDEDDEVVKVLLY